MKRRTFLSIVATGGAAAVGAYALRGSFDGIVRRILKNELTKLAVSEDTINRFVKDAAKDNIWSQFSQSKKLLIRFHFVFSSSVLKFPYYHKYLHYKNIIIGDFLFATDYFTNNNRKIKYIGIFNPYKRVCFNPFSNVLNT